MKIFFCLITFIFTINYSCSNTSKPIVPFLEALKIEINNDKKLIIFKEAPKDTEILYFINHFSEAFDLLYKNDSINYKNINDYMDSQSIINDQNIRAASLIFAFQKKLQNKDIDIKEIAKFTQNYYKEIEEEELVEKDFHNQQTKKIIQANEEKWNIGDTLYIILPINKEESGYCSTYFNNYGYPYTLDYSLADDTLHLEGILLQKLYEDYAYPYTGTPDSLESIFKLKITAMSDMGCLILGEKYVLGDEYKLPLQSYGRCIN